MITRDFNGMKLSGLGMGAMRLPATGTNLENIDQAAVQEMVDYAMEQGINYYDTAYGYHDGQSEIAMGKALSKYPRDSFYLADKFPGYDINNMSKVQEIFEEQLEKCGVEYFDFYLFHNVCEMNIDGYLDPQYGIYDYLMKQKENGRIKHLGFSAHGDIPTMTRFLEAYGDSMEFGQLQLNFLDYSFQDAKGKVELLSKYNIPVWVMEPLRGGSLCKLAEEHEATLKVLRPEETPTTWAFRFLQSLPEVTMVLSGMSNFEQMKQNIETWNTEKPLSEEEMNTLLGIADEMLKHKVLPCTACRYCTTHCPQELDIPTLISLYNEHNFTGGGFIAPMALAAYDEDKKPSACIGCRSCEAVCPQQIKISEAMSDFASKL